MGKISTWDTREENTNSIKKSIIILCVFLAAVHTFIGAYKMISRPSDSVFDSVDGFILASDIETHAIEGTNGSDQTNLFYDAMVRFQYIVNGKTYVNSQILGHVTRNDPTRAQEVMDAYTEGKVVRILFDPQTPSSSRIDTTSAVVPVPYFLMGIVFVLSAILAHRMITVNTFRRKRTASRQVQPLAEARNAVPRSPEKTAPSPKPQSVIAGSWALDFQVPSMGEIIAATQQASLSGHNERNALMQAGKANLTINISNHEIQFNYKDGRNQGGCELLSSYLLEGNTLTLEHKSMDFLMVDIQDFPPQSYTYSQKGSKLVLTSNEIRGLGNRRITFHLSRAA